MKRTDAQASPLPIGEVARRAGVAASAIRYYERRGLIPPAARRGGKRIYGADVLDRLVLIGLAKAAGFRIAEIGALVRGVGRRTPPGPRWRSLAARKAGELAARRAQIERMERVLGAVARCRCPTFADCARAVRAARPAPLT
jgi:MerR family transcriptional regulator, redox-sensitive transcriptional activator SoxR